MNNFISFYKNCDGSFRTYDFQSQQFDTVQYLPKQQSNFFISGKYEPNDEELVRYANDLLTSAEQLKKSPHVKYFDYISPFQLRNGGQFIRTHTTNIENVFKILSKGKYENHEKITYTEYQWFEKTYNGGLLFVNPGTHPSYGYDFKNFYASILGSSDSKLRIPITVGKQKKIETLPKKPKLGLYKFKVACDDHNFKKSFMLSKNNVYTSYELTFLYELQELGFNIKLDVIIDDDKFNCIFWDKDSTVCSNEIFGNWYNGIIALKKDFPKNILTKMLSSSLWGHLSASNIQLIHQDDVDRLNVGVDDRADFIIQDLIIKDDGTTFYRCMKKDQPYKFNLRLKSFVTAYGRIQSARVALMNIDHVVRIHTDGIVFDEELTAKVDNLISEDKTTGFIEWSNINKYKPITSSSVILF